MTKSQALARIYETYSEDELLAAKDEPDAELIQRFLGSGSFYSDAYNEVQREFGWDDTH